jgi:hypothetical protein
MIDFLNGKILELTALVRGASVLGAIVVVAMTYYKARSLVALLVAALTAGVFLWTISNTSWWTQRVQDETNTMGGHVVVVSIDHQPVGLFTQVV